MHRVHNLFPDDWRALRQVLQPYFFRLIPQETARATCFRARDYYVVSRSHFYFDVLRCRGLAFGFYGDGTRRRIPSIEFCERGLDSTFNAIKFHLPRSHILNFNRYEILSFDYILDSALFDRREQRKGS